MSIGTGYIYNQRGDVVLTNRTGTTRNIHSNFKPFVAHKGMNTAITFFVRGDDGKPVQLHDKQVVATAIKHNTNTVAFTKSLITTEPESGTCVLKITSTDIYEADSGMYSLILTYTDLSGNTSAIYMNHDKRVEYVLDLRDAVIPAPLEPTVIDTFNPVVDNISLSNTFAGSAQGVHTSGLNTFAVYSTNATGTFVVEATLESDPTSTDWFTLSDPVTLTAQTGIQPYTYEGKFVWLRIRTDISDGTIDKITYLY